MKGAAGGGEGIESGIVSGRGRGRPPKPIKLIMEELYREERKRVTRIEERLGKLEKDLVVHTATIDEHARIANIVSGRVEKLEDHEGHYLSTTGGLVKHLTERLEKLERQVKKSEEHFAGAIGNLCSVVDSHGTRINGLDKELPIGRLDDFAKRLEKIERMTNRAVESALRTDAEGYNELKERLEKLEARTHDYDNAKTRIMSLQDRLEQLEQNVQSVKSIGGLQDRIEKLEKGPSVNDAVTGLGQKIAYLHSEIISQGRRLDGLDEWRKVSSTDFTNWQKIVDRRLTELGEEVDDNRPQNIRLRLEKLEERIKDFDADNRHKPSIQRVNELEDRIRRQEGTKHELLQAIEATREYVDTRWDELKDRIGRIDSNELISDFTKMEERLEKLEASKLIHACNCDLSKDLELLRRRMEKMEAIEILSRGLNELIQNKMMEWIREQQKKGVPNAS